MTTINESEINWIENGEKANSTNINRPLKEVLAKIGVGAAVTDNSVTENKIANGSVTENKIANDSVTESKIANNSVTTDKLANDVTNLIDSKVAKTTTITAGTGLTGGGDLSTNRTISANVGTAAGTVAAGNDSRIINGQTAYSWGDHEAAGYALENRTITTNNGLTGGGDLSANRTIGINGVNTSTGSTSKYLSQKGTFEDIPTGVDISGKADKTTTITTNNGLTGGGDLSANRTFSVVYGTTSGTVAEGNDSRINNGQTAHNWGNHADMGYAIASAVIAALDTKYDKTGGVISGDVQIGTSGNFKDLSVSGKITASQGVYCHNAFAYYANGYQISFMTSSAEANFRTTSSKFDFNKPIFASNLFGQGQVWQEFTSPARDKNETYLNTTGRPILVVIFALGDGGNENDWFYVDGVLVGGYFNQVSGAATAVSFIVPNGSNYRFESSSSASYRWSELR